MNSIPIFATKCVLEPERIVGNKKCTLEIRILKINKIIGTGKLLRITDDFNICHESVYYLNTRFIFIEIILNLVSIFSENMFYKSISI